LETTFPSKKTPSTRGTARRFFLLQNKNHFTPGLTRSPCSACFSRTTVFSFFPCLSAVCVFLTGPRSPFLAFLVMLSRFFFAWSFPPPGLPLDIPLPHFLNTFQSPEHIFPPPPPLSLTSPPPCCQNSLCAAPFYNFSLLVPGTQFTLPLSICSNLVFVPRVRLPPPLFSEPRVAPPKKPTSPCRAVRARQKFLSGIVSTALLRWPPPPTIWSFSHFPCRRSQNP